MKSKINKEILRLAVPNIISNISVPLLSTIDTILMGNLSSIHLAAVGLGSMIFNIIYWNFGFLRMGTTGITAQHYGAGESKGVWLSFLRAALLAIVISCILLALQTVLFYAGSWALNVSENTDTLVYTYYSIRIWAAPASLLLMALMGWYFGIQNAIIPLVLTIIINVINIIVSYYLVAVSGMGVAGVAIGTVIAQYVGLVVGIIILAVKFGEYTKQKVADQLKIFSAYSRFMKVNGDLFLRTVCLTFAFGFFYSQSSKISDTVLAINVVLMQYVNWMSYGIDGFAFASESLVGKYKGAKDFSALKTVITQSFIWGGAVGVIYAAVYFIFGESLFGIFSKDENLYLMANELLIYMAIFPILAFASYIWDGIFVGLTATSSMRNAMILSLITFFLAYYMYPPQNNGSHIWFALSAFVVARALFQWLYYKKYGLDLT